MLFLSIETNYSGRIFLASFCYFHKQANLYLRGPNMKILQQENICSMLKDVLKGKENVDVVKLHKSREVVPRNYKYQQHMRIYRIRVRAMMQYHDILLNCSYFKTFLFIAENLHICIFHFYCQTCQTHKIFYFHIVALNMSFTTISFPSFAPLTIVDKIVHACYYICNSESFFKK